MVTSHTAVGGGGGECSARGARIEMVLGTYVSDIGTPMSFLSPSATYLASRISACAMCDHDVRSWSIVLPILIFLALTNGVPLTRSNSNDSGLSGAVTGEALTDSSQQDMSSHSVCCGQSRLRSFWRVGAFHRFVSHDCHFQEYQNTYYTRWTSSIWSSDKVFAWLALECSKAHRS